MSSAASTPDAYVNVSRKETRSPDPFLTVARSELYDIK